MRHHQMVDDRPQCPLLVSQKFPFALRPVFLIFYCMAETSQRPFLRVDSQYGAPWSGERMFKVQRTSC